jgi:hypothetical protein
MDRDICGLVVLKTRSTNEPQSLPAPPRSRSVFAGGRLGTLERDRVHGSQSRAASTGMSLGDSGGAQTAASRFIAVALGHTEEDLMNLAVSRIWTPPIYRHLIASAFPPKADWKSGRENGMGPEMEMIEP